MVKSRDTDKYIVFIRVILMIAIAILTILLGRRVAMAADQDALPEAVQCSFLLPPEFQPSSEAGLFLNKDYPMESSSIKYSVYANGRDRVLTNREKRELAESGQLAVMDESDKLTKEIYQDAMEAAYKEKYGQDVEYSVTFFEKSIFDGYPGFKISAEFQPKGDIMIKQTVFIILSKYKTFTIAYQRAEDDECDELFNTSASTIHVR